VTRWHRPAAECDVTLRANKTRALVSLIELVVENSTFIERRRNVATFGAATRFHGHLLRGVTRCVHPRHIVTLRALQIGMDFMSERAG
jgi:hypothetical protein